MEVALGGPSSNHGLSQQKQWVGVGSSGPWWVWQ